MYRKWENKDLNDLMYLNFKYLRIFELQYNKKIVLWEIFSLQVNIGTVKNLKRL